MPDGGTVALDYEDYAADLKRQALLDEVNAADARLQPASAAWTGLEDSRQPGLVQRCVSDQTASSSQTHPARCKLSAQWVHSLAEGPLTDAAAHAETQCLTAAALLACLGYGCSALTPPALVSMQPHRGPTDQAVPPDAPVLILLPGLTGGSSDTYVRHMVGLTRRHGMRALVFNSRCSLPEHGRERQRKRGRLCVCVCVCVGGCVPCGGPQAATRHARPGP